MEEILQRRESDRGQRCMKPCMNQRERDRLGESAIISFVKLNKYLAANQQNQADTADEAQRSESSCKSLKLDGESPSVNEFVKLKANEERSNCVQANHLLSRGNSLKDCQFWVNGLKPPVSDLITGFALNMPYYRA